MWGEGKEVSRERKQELGTEVRLRDMKEEQVRDNEENL